MLYNILQKPSRQGGCREGFYVCTAKPHIRRQGGEVGGTEKPAILGMSRLKYKMKMKKLSLVAIMLIALVSCEKEQLNSDLSLSMDENLVVNNNKAAKMRIFYDHGGNNYGCTGSGGSCADDVIVKPAPKGEGFESLFDAIYKNDTDKVISLFQKHGDYFIEYIDQEIINLVVKGELKASLRGNESDNTKYIIFTSSVYGKVVAVYPLSLK
jgi:hypothetical protein